MITFVNYYAECEFFLSILITFCRENTIQTCKQRDKGLSINKCYLTFHKSR